MKNNKSDAVAQRPDQAAPILEAPMLEAPMLEVAMTLSADQLEAVAAGTMMSLTPGRPGPVNGIIYAPTMMP